MVIPHMLARNSAINLLSFCYKLYTEDSYQIENSLNIYKTLAWLKYIWPGKCDF